MKESDVVEYLTSGRGLRFIVDFRTGDFNESEARNLLKMISNIEVDQDKTIPRSLVMHVWSIPFHAMCYRETAIEKGHSQDKIDAFISDAIDAVGSIIDVKTNGFPPNYVI